MRCDATLHQRQQLVDHQRQRRRRDAAEQHEHRVLRLQAGENVIAEARLPDRVDSVAVPITHAAAMRMPAMITGIAIGRSICQRICHGVSANAVPASRSLGIDAGSPVTVLRNTGSIE